MVVVLLRKVHSHQVQVVKVSISAARNTDNSPDGDNPSYTIDQTSAPMPGTGFASGGGGGMRNHSYPSNDEFDNDVW